MTMATNEPVLSGGCFNPAAWLQALTQIGGGYALAADRRLFLLVDECEASELTRVMSHVVGKVERLDAVRRLIEQRQNGEMAA
jgi:hypothetical protein